MSREALAAEMENCIHLVPGHLRGGLSRYLLDHLRPGQFLQSVLSNDLRMTIGRADDTSLAHLRSIVQFLTMVAPAPSWGSVEALEAWIAMAEAAD